MHISEQHLPHLANPLADLDLDEDSGWVAVTASSGRNFLHFGMHVIDAPERCAFPLVRSLSDGTLLLVDKCTWSKRANAWIIDTMGTIHAHFYVGNSVNDVVVADRCLAVTYGDEAFGNREGLCGVVLFDLEGHPLYRHNDSGGPAVIDCYCACPLSRKRVLFLTYPGFSVVVMDIATHQALVWQEPVLVDGNRPIAGAHAVTSAGDTAFFHGSYDDRERIYRWRLGDLVAHRIGEYSGSPRRLRGLLGGRFLAANDDSYSLLTHRRRMTAN